jgi:4-amino-4-deoxy-L-arabinose transferase-like glycosyltransferase
LDNWPSPRYSGKTEWLLLLAILAISFCLRLAFLHEPFERDEGLYAYVGQEILRGAIPYKDVIEIKPPGTFYLYAAGIGVFGDTTESIRLFTALYSLISVYFVYRIARYLSGPQAGLLAGFLYAIYSSGPLLQGSSSNTEVFMVMPLLAGTYLFLRGADTGRRVYLMGCGLAAGMAMLIKTVALTQAVVLFSACFFVRRSGSGFKGRGLDALGFAVPPLILALLTVSYFAYHGALADFFYWNIAFAGKYRSASITGPPFFGVVGHLLPEMFLLALVAFPTALFLILREREIKCLVVALLLPPALAGVCLPGKNFPHYFIQLVPPMAVLAGIGLGRISGQRGVPLYVAAAAVVTVFGWSISREYMYYTVLTPEQVSISKYGDTFVQSVPIANYLKERTRPEEYIFQWGLEPELYFLSNRRSPVRYLGSVGLEWSADPAAATRELVEGIERKKPRYIVLQQEWAWVQGIMEIDRILRRDYYLENRIGYAYIFRRKDTHGR